jgi:hypothetical protein
VLALSRRAPLVALITVPVLANVGQQHGQERHLTSANDHLDVVRRARNVPPSFGLTYRLGGKGADRVENAFGGSAPYTAVPRLMLLGNILPTFFAATILIAFIIRPRPLTATFGADAEACGVGVLLIRLPFSARFGPSRCFGGAT